MQIVIDFFQYCLNSLPLELFVMIGTFIEEVISPIPSFLVLVPSGAAAAARGHVYWYLLILMVCSAVGRIAGSVIIYKAADKLENVVLRHHRFFDVSHEQIEQLGQRLGRGKMRDWAALFILNAIPIFPTGALSLACGFLKVNFKMFAFCSFFGTMINALVFMTIGYTGVRVAETLHGIELAGKITTGVLLLVAIVWFIRYRQKVIARRSKQT